ncbi:MAG TPA: GMC family oxidoreductase, partial [Polyangiaceae bacterium]|nr:GMC family oxidoreductase [Polyangiaceae bacterium]
ALERLVRWTAEAIYAEPGAARARAWATLGYPEREPGLDTDAAPATKAEPDAAAAVNVDVDVDVAAPSPASTPFDAIVIGAGVSGSIVTGILARAGFRVLLLERGDDARARALQQDHLANHRLSLYGHNTGPALDGHPRVAVDVDGQRRVLRPHENGYHNNAVGVGGGGLVFGGQAWRFHPNDFAMASRYGVPDNSSLADWPLSYADLAPFYERAEREIGVAGEPGARVGAPHTGAYPMPPHAGHPGRAALAVAAHRLGWRPHGVPLAINSIPRDGRGACSRCNACVGFACPTDAKNGGHNTLLAAARKSTPHVTLATESTAVSIDSDASGRVIGVTYRASPPSSPVQARARVVIVASGAIESARLLLDSPSVREPNGLGNDHDQVGRHLQGHVYASATALMPDPIEDGCGPGPSIAVTDLCHDNPGIIGGGLLADDFVLLPIIAWRDHLPGGAPRWGAASGRFLADHYRRLLKVCGPIQEIPNPDSRVSLDPFVRDLHGRRVPRLSGTVHPESVRAAEFLRQRAEDWLRASGAERVWSTPFTHSAFLSAGQHQAGTCRMGHDPRSSVVDSFGRVHGHDNLYVIDSSVHVTNGGMNPVLTIMALALRNAEALARVHG